MDRIVVKYRPAKGNITSNLIIYNDLKGNTVEKIGLPFYGAEADIMLKILQGDIKIWAIDSREREDNLNG